MKRWRCFGASSARRLADLAESAMCRVRILTNDKRLNEAYADRRGSGCGTQCGACQRLLATGRRAMKP